MRKTGIKKPSDSNDIKTLRRGLRILEEVCHQADGVTQSEVARKMGVNRSTALRYLTTLQVEGYITRDGEALYRPTVKMAELARRVIDKMEIKPYAQEQLNRLTGRTGFSSHLALLSDRRIVYVDGEQATGVVRVNADIGTAAPIHCSATGKALAAYIERGEREIVVASYLEGADSFTVYTEQTISNPLDLEKEFSHIRAYGYALDDEEYEPGVRCLAAPIFNERGQVAAVIGISGTAVRLNRPAVPKLAALVCHAADSISRAIGCSDPRSHRKIDPDSIAGAGHQCK